MSSLFFAIAAVGCSNDSTPGPATTHGDGAPDAPQEDTRPCEASTLVTGTFNLMHAGVPYGYVVHVPPSYDGTKRTPLVLNWHPYGSTALEEVLFTGTDAVSDENGFIVVYPNSPDKSWAAGRCCTNFDGGMPDRDDVGFARALVAEISNKACIDSKRVYAMGMSNGGFMSHRLACEAADVFAAIVPVASTMGVADCRPSRPISVMHHHGTGDLTVGYDTAELSAEGVSVPEMMKLWGARNGCTKGPDTTFQMGTVTCQTWSGCTAGVLVTLCTAEGSGHCWPGAQFCPGDKPFTKDISASRDGWAFMQKFMLP
ncbi:MAG TPA: PHB depolymerase family esterase [Polyangiaceae bacterium]|nr:PHB depolymerase family esterase [Polyangiaceae bacterium]